MHIASRLAAGTLATTLLVSAEAAAQSAPAPGPFRISDNSFLVEEAFNQEKGVFQNIFGATRMNGDWAATFTQEWPVVSQRHQFSYTLAWMTATGRRGFGDTLLNYRWQAMMEGAGRPAFSPRASLILPTGSSSRGMGDGSAGLQVNLPFSKRTSDWYWHWNAGLTWLPRARAEGAAARRENLVTPFVAGSAIVRVRPMLHLMLETVVSFDESIAAAGTARDRAVTMSPGLRGGWTIGDRQVVLGFAVPVTWQDGRGAGAFLYASYELPFDR